MQLSVMDPKALSFEDIVNNMDTLYYIAPKRLSYSETKMPNGERRFLMEEDSCSSKTLGLFPLTESGLLNMKDTDYLIVRITNHAIPEPTPKEEEPKEDPVIFKPATTKHALSYKFNGGNAIDTIFVNYKPVNGNIRCEFKDREAAETYFDYFREQFYKRRSGVDFITVSNIYEDLQIVNYNPDDCNIWGWPTLESGECKHMTGYVTKSKNSNLFGFTLKHPVMVGGRA